MHAEDRATLGGQGGVRFDCRLHEWCHPRREDPPPLREHGSRPFGELLIELLEAQGVEANILERAETCARLGHQQVLPSDWSPPLREVVP
jgi:hypothetical protein